MELIKLILTTNGVTLVAIIAACIIYFRSKAKVKVIKLPGGGQVDFTGDERRTDDTRINNIDEICISMRQDMKLMSEVVTDLQDNQKDMLKKLHELYLGQLRSIVTNEQLPPSARIEAYDIYVKEGGNGWLQTYADKHVKPLLEKVMYYRLGEKNE